MKSKYSHPKFENLSDENIESAVKTADQFFRENGIEVEHISQCCPMLESILRAYQKKDENVPFRLLFWRSWKKIKVSVLLKSESFNILEEEKDTFSPEQIPEPYRPDWKYKGKQNRVTFHLPVKTPDLNSLKYVLRYMDTEKGAFRQGVVMRFLNMITLVLEPWMAAKLIEAFNASDIRGIVTYAVIFLILEVSSGIFTFLGTRWLVRAYTTMREKMRIDATSNVLNIKTEHIDTIGTGVFTERLVRETARVVEGLDDMVYVITEAFRLISLLIAFASISKTMLIFELILFVVYLLITRSQSEEKNEDYRRVYAATENYSGFIGEMIRATRDIKLLHSEQSFLIRVKDVITETTDRERESDLNDCSHLFARKQFVAWTNFIYLIILAIMMAKFGLPPATALILYNYNGKVFISTRAVAGATESIYRLLLSSERVYQLMESSDYSKEEFGDKALENVKGEIEFKDVDFTYSHDGLAPVPVLNGLSLHIPAGQSVALVGHSGCGKSTLLSLISRLYEPTGGTVTLDGVDVKELDKDTIRNSIGMVTQSPYLFSMSLKDNFRLIKSDATDEEIIEVCKKACVHEDIMSLPDGYDTMIGEGGGMLSGGQRQRIALARALLKDYPVIMLDEATSALDNETQSAIRDAIENMHDGRTVIMIAHRLSTVVHCQQLFYIENGKVLSSGTHEELLKNCTPYRMMFNEEAATD